MDKKQARLMLKLADHLADFKEPKEGDGGVGFDMGVWFLKFKEDPEWDVSSWAARQRKKHPCGTSACAMGHAGLMPCFNRVGLMTDKKHGTVKITVDGEEYSDFAAAVHVFGINKGEAYDLFDAIECTAKQKAKHLRKFVKSKFPELVKPKEKA